MPLDQAYSTTSVNVCPLCGAPATEGALTCKHDGTRLVHCPAPGSLVFEKYRFESLIGAGGMGVIYRCHSPYMARDVAIKTLLGRTMRHEALIRFQQEARTTGALNHPGIVSINDFGITNEGHPFMVMEYFPGKTLAQLLQEGCVFSLGECLEICLQICDTVAFAHSRGVLHRDLKPSNVMLCQSDGIQIKILDFGIAKMIEGESMSMTRTGEIFGSPAYMSPEQGAGLDVAPASDIYSLGCLFYQLISGEPPFTGGSSLELLQKHRDEVVQPLSEVFPDENLPAELDELVMQMLAKSQSERPASVNEVIERLEAIHLDFERSRLAEEKKRLNEQDGQTLILKTEAHQGIAQFVAIVVGRLSLLLCTIGGVLVAIGFLGLWLSLNNRPEPSLIGAASIIPEAIPIDHIRDDSSKVVLGCRSDVYDAVASQAKYVPLNLVELRDQDFAELAGDTNLESLSMDDSSGITPHGLAQLKGLHLKDLSFNGTDINDDCCKVIADYSDLENLSLQGCHSLTDRALTFLSRPGNNIKILGIGDTNFTVNGLSHLADMHHLHTLYLGALSIQKFFHDADFKAIAKAKSLVQLNADGQSEITDEAVAALHALPALRNVGFARSKLTSRSLLLLSKMPSIVSADFTDCPNISDKDIARYNKGNDQHPFKRSLPARKTNNFLKQFEDLMPAQRPERER